MAGRKGASGGHNRKPTRQKELEGTLRKDRRPRNEPAPEEYSSETLPKPPTWLGKYGRQVWRRLGPVLADNRLLTEADLESLAAYCRAWHELRVAQESLDQHGRVVEIYRILGEGDEARKVLVGLRANPAYQHARIAVDQIARLGRELGLSPAARGGISLPDEPAAKSALLDFLDRKRNREAS